jgi:D-alanine-D-alanine ligase
MDEIGRARVRVLVLHNLDFAGTAKQDAAVASRADVLVAAKDVAAALEQNGHEVRSFGVPHGAPGTLAATDGVRDLLKELHAWRPDVVFNLCESLGADSSSEPLVPMLLDLGGVLYTGASPHALHDCLYKDRCKLLLQNLGVPTPSAICLSHELELLDRDVPLPAIVKLSREDASVGISSTSVVRTRAELNAQVQKLRSEFHQPVLIETYVEGREVYVSMIGNPPVALPMHEIDFSLLQAELPRIVTYDGKWNPTSADYLGTPVKRAELDDALRDKVATIARRVFTGLGLRDYARVDLRIDAAGEPFVIDVNPNCDLSSGAGVAKAAGFAKMSYAQLIEAVLRAALDRRKGKA